ncbi:MAG: hypothetical protein WA693_12485, partial [Pseudolabrys sp.]
KLFLQREQTSLTLNVRFGSKADMCSAKRHVRFVPITDILASQRDVRSYLESGHLLASIEYPLKCH